MGAHPSAWMIASLGILLISPMSNNSLKAAVHTQRTHATADRLDVPIGSAPAESFHDLVGDGFHGFAGGDGTGAAVQEEVFALGELRGDLFGLVVVAADADDFRAEEGGFAQFFLRHEAGHEDPQFDPARAQAAAYATAALPVEAMTASRIPFSFMAATATAA
jgi:hypothetical protein